MSYFTPESPIRPRNLLLCFGRRRNGLQIQCLLGRFRQSQGMCLIGEALQPVLVLVHSGFEMLERVHTVAARAKPLNLIPSVLIRCHRSNSIYYSAEALLRDENDSHTGIGFIVGAGYCAAKLGTGCKYQVEGSAGGRAESFFPYVVTARGCRFEVHLGRSAVGAQLVPLIRRCLKRE